MKSIARKLFAPILNVFEQGTEDFKYKPLNRTILNIVGGLFILMTLSIVYLVPNEQSGKFIPILVFGALGLLCLIIGLFGNNRAVSKIWGNK